MTDSKKYRVIAYFQTRLIQDKDITYIRKDKTTVYVGTKEDCIEFLRNLGLDFMLKLKDVDTCYRFTSDLQHPLTNSFDFMIERFVGRRYIIHNSTYVMARASSR